MFEYKCQIFITSYCLLNSHAKRMIFELRQLRGILKSVKSLKYKP